MRNALTSTEEKKPVLFDKDGNVLIPFKQWDKEDQRKYVAVMRKELLIQMSDLIPKPINFETPLLRDVYLKGVTPRDTERDEIEIALILRYLLLTRGEAQYDSAGMFLGYTDSLDLYKIDERWYVSRNGAMQSLLTEDETGELEEDERRAATAEKVKQEFAKVLLFANPHLLTPTEFKKVSSTTGWDRILTAFAMLPGVILHGEMFGPVTLEVARTPKGMINTGVGFYDYERGLLHLHKGKFKENQWMSSLAHEEPSHMASANYTTVVPNLRLLQKFKNEEGKQLRNRFFSREFVERWFFHDHFASVWHIFLSRFSVPEEAIYFLLYVSATLTRGVQKLGLFVIGHPDSGKTALLRLLRLTLQENVGMADSDALVKEGFENYNNKLLPFSKYPLVFIDELPKGKVVDDIAYKTIVNEQSKTMTITEKWMADRPATMIGRPVVFTNHAMKIDALGVADRSQLVNCDVVIDKTDQWNFSFDRDYAPHASDLLTLLIIMGRCWYYNRYIGENKGNKIDILSWYETEEMRSYKEQLEAESKPVIEFVASRLEYVEGLPAYKAIKLKTAYRMFLDFYKEDLGMKDSPTRQEFADDLCEFVLKTSYQKYRNDPNASSGNVQIIPGYQAKTSNNLGKTSNNQD